MDFLRYSRDRVDFFLRLETSRNPFPLRQTAKQSATAPSLRSLPHGAQVLLQPI